MVKIPQEIRQKIFNYVLNRLEIVNERVLEEGKGFSQRLGLDDVADQISIGIDKIFEEVE